MLNYVYSDYFYYFKLKKNYLLHNVHIRITYRVFNKSLHSVHIYEYFYYQIYEYYYADNYFSLFIKYINLNGLVLLFKSF